MDTARLSSSVVVSIGLPTMGYSSFSVSLLLLIWHEGNIFGFTVQIYD